MSSGEQRLRSVISAPEMAFALPHGDLDALVEVADLACDVWNGAGSLILPIDKRGRVTGRHLEYLQIRRVDSCAVHERVPDAALLGLAQALGTQPTRLHPDFLRRVTLHPLNLQPTYRSGVVRPRLAVPTFTRLHFRRMARIVWGRIAKEDRADYELAFELDTIEGEDAYRAFLADQVEQRTILAQSMYGMGAYEQSGFWDSRILFIFNRCSFNELVAFWNLRARLASFGGRVRAVGVPIEVMTRLEALEPLLSWLEQEHYQVQKPDLEVMPWGKRALESVGGLDALGFTRVEGLRPGSFSPDRVPAERQRLEYGGFSGLAGPFRRGILFDTVVGLREGDNLVRFTPPASFRPYYGGVVQFQITNLPLAFPLNDPAARRIHVDARTGVDGFAINVRLGGDPFDLPLRMPSADEGLADFLEPHGLRGELSQAGRYAQAVLRQLHSLDDVAALAGEEAQAVVTALTPLSVKKLAQHVRHEILESKELSGEINDDALEAILSRQELYLELPAKTLAEIGSVSGRKKRDLAPALAELVRVGFVVRGASLRCPHCNYPAFYLLSELDERLDCRGCRLEFSLPVVDSGGADEQALHYRLDGLTAQAMDQDLAPALLLARRLAGRSFGNPTACYWPGLNLFRASSSQPHLEIDLLVAGSGDVSVAECKRRAESLSVVDATAFVHLGGLLGARPVFAALEGAFSDEINELAREHDAWLLDRGRLFTTDTGLAPPHPMRSS